MWCFDPELRLRRAETNVYCYAIDRIMASFSRQQVLHPLDAIVLTLFNGRRSDEEVAEILGCITDSGVSHGRDFLSKFLSKYSSCLVNNGTNDQYDPHDFVMPASIVDLSTFRLTTPLQITLLLTYNCTSNCAYCYANKNSPEDADEMNLEFAKDIVDQASECGVELIYVGGGDPFTRPWIIELLRGLCAKGIVPVISTKEFLSPAKCEELAETGIENIQVSIDTLESAVGDRLTGRQGYVKGALQTIRNLQSVGIDVTTNTVITGINVRQLPELVHYLIDNGVVSIVLSRYYRSTYQHSDWLFVDDDDVAWLSDAIAGVENPTGVSIVCPFPENKERTADEMNTFLKRTACAFGRVGVVVSPSGKVLPCEQLPSRHPFVLGDLHHQSLADIWNGQALRALLYPDKDRFTGTACCDCDDFEGCIHKRGWCIRDVYKVYGTPFGTIPSCPRATHNVRLT